MTPLVVVPCPWPRMALLISVGSRIDIRHLIVGSANEGNVCFVDLELNSAKEMINLMKYW